MEWFIGIVVLIVVGIILSVNADFKKKDALMASLVERLPGADFFVSDADGSYCALHRDKRKIIIGLRKPRGGWEFREEPYEGTYQINAIRKVEIKTNGTTVASTNRGSQAVGAAVGALAFGGVGAIIGGLSASTSSHEHIRSVTLTVTVEDAARPIHTLTFLDASHEKKGLPLSDGRVVSAMKHAEVFAALIENAMRPSSSAAVATMPQPSENSVGLIKELWELKEAGAITQKEFDAEKRRILRKSSGARNGAA